MDALEPAAGPLAAVDGGGALVARTLTVHGSGLTWRTTPPAVLFGGAALALAAAPPPSPNALAVTLPLDQAAGPQVDVQVRAGPRTSVALPFTVTPWLARIVPLRTALDGPTVLTLTGSGFGPAGAHVRLTARRRPTAARWPPARPTARSASRCRARSPTASTPCGSCAPTAAPPTAGRWR